MLQWLASAVAAPVLVVYIFSVIVLGVGVLAELVAWLRGTHRE